MIAVELVAAFLLGAAAGAGALFRLLPARFRHHVDYRERWQAAVGLLGAQGQLTAEQVKTITADLPVPAPRGRLQVQAGGDGSVQIQAGGDVTLRTLRGMFSDDRRDLEIERARQGLPPMDDLRGMFSDDIREVMKARARYTRRDTTGGPQ